MFDTGRRLSALEADLRLMKEQLNELRRTLDPAELVRLQTTVLNALRSLRRKAEGGDTQVAPPSEIAAPEGNQVALPPEIMRLDPLSQRIWLKRRNGRAS